MIKYFKVLSAFIAFIILALLVVPLFMDANHYKSEISSMVFDATGRHLQIEHIDLSAFPWVGVRLRNVQLQNTSGFTQPHILTVKSVDIQLELFALLNQQIEVKRFNLDEPKIWLESHADETNNWSNPLQVKPLSTNTIQDSYTATQTSSPVAIKTAQHSQPIIFNADLLRLHNGQVTWTDPYANTIQLSDIQLEVHDLQLKQPVSIDFSAKLGEDQFSAHANIGPIGDIHNLDFSKLPILLNLQSSGLSFKPLSPWLPNLKESQIAQLSNLNQASINFDISLEQHADSVLLSTGVFRVQMEDMLSGSWKVDSKNLKTLNIQEFKVAVNDNHILALSGKVKHLKNNPHFEVRMETPKLQRIWLNQFAPNLRSLYLNHPKPWQSIKLGTLIAGDRDILEIRDLHLQLDDEPVQISGNLALGQAPDAQLRISANELHLDPWIPTTNRPGPTAQSGTTQAEAEPDLTFLKPWYLSLQFNAKSIYAAKLKLDNVRITLSAEKGVVRLNPLSLEVGEGQLTENFTLYANRYPATWKESIRMSGVSVSPILHTVADFNKLSGIAQLETNLSGKGLLSRNITRNMNGYGHFIFENGQLKGVDIAKEVSNPKGAATSSQSTDFAQMQGNFRINNGLLVNNDLYMSSPLFRLTGKGKLNLSPLKVDYHVRPRLIESLAGQSGSRTEQGVVIPLHISGPMNRLKVSVELDNNALLENAATSNHVGGVAGRSLNQGFDTTKDEEAKKAADKLDDALKNFKF